MSSDHSSKLSVSKNTQLQEFLCRLRSLRQERGLTQAELAALVGVSRATYENLERGRANLSLHSLLRLLSVLGCAQRFSELLPKPNLAKALARKTAAPRRKPPSTVPLDPVEVRCLLD